MINDHNILFALQRVGCDGYFCFRFGFVCPSTGLLWFLSIWSLSFQQVCLCMCCVLDLTATLQLHAGLLILKLLDPGSGAHSHTDIHTHAVHTHSDTDTRRHTDTRTHGHKDMGIARVVVIDGFPLTLITTLSQKSWSCGMGSKVPTPRYWLGLFPSSSSWLANLGRDLFN